MTAKNKQQQIPYGNDKPEKQKQIRFHPREQRTLSEDPGLQKKSNVNRNGCHDRHRQ
jgi:hypothetical protein